MLKAANDWILVKRAKKLKEEIVGAIAVVNSDQDAIQRVGVVVTVGPDLDNNILPGDTVIWGTWDGTRVLWNKEEYVAIRNTDVILYGRPA